MSNLSPFLIRLACCALLTAAIAHPLSAAPSAQELLADAIAYHDPHGVWGTVGLRLTLDSPRSNGVERSIAVEIDPTREYFRFRQESEGTLLEGELNGEHCTAWLNGSPTISEAERSEHRLSCDQVVRRRDYFAYLWGLPMKLRDPGTVVHPGVRETRFDGRDALEIKVSYDESVGSDTWYFYFHPESHALTGYRFYHDEAKGDGEYIYLEGETVGAGLRLPRARAWYTHAEDRYLGTDTLLSVEILE